MPEEARVGSILLADCGTVTTKAVLLDRVEGQYNFVACGEVPTTAEFPWTDVSIGIRHAVEQISDVTGRRFFDEGGDLITPEVAGRQGVDIFAATVSASQPLQVVLSGLVSDLSVASGQRAAAGTYSQVKAILSGDGRDGALTEEERVRRIRDAAPDVILIVGGTDGGARPPVLGLVEAAALACALLNDTGVHPRILFAGNARLRERVAALLDGQIELSVADNVRPRLTEEAVYGAQVELDNLYVSEKMGTLPGLNTVSEWSPVPLVPTARAFGRLVQYLWHLGDPRHGVLGLDVGGANVVLAAVFGGQLYTTVRSDLGTAFGAEHFLEAHGAELITRWMPEPMDPQEAQGLLLNKELRPSSIPQVPRELWLEQALARQLARTALETAQPGWRPGVAQVHPRLLPLIDTILVSGGVLAHAPRPGQAALTVLDALEPIGVTTLVLDAHGLAPALGNVALVRPLAAVEALDSGSFVNLATVVTPVGRARRGDIILKARITYDDGGTLSVEIHQGDLEVLPLPPGKRATLELRPARRFDVGLGGPGRGGKRRVTGGLVGVIVDARGRPLRLPTNPQRRQQQVRQWLWDVGG